MATLNTRIVLRNDESSKWVNSTVVLKKGEIGVENDTGYFKIGNGSDVWSVLPYANKFEATPVAAHYEVDATAEQTDDAAIAAKLETLGAVAKLDDIAIVKREIAAGKLSFTAYVYNGSAWTAMDGNYNAENVYFDEDIMITTAVGNISLSNGSANIPAAGKNIKQVFEALWTKEDFSPSVTDPSISISVKNANDKSSVEGEVGDSYTLPTATASITGFGKFEFGSKDEAGTFYAANASSDVVFSELRVGKADTAAALDESNSEVITNVGASSTPKSVSRDGEAGIFVDGATVQKFSARAAHGGSARKAVSNLGNLVNTSGTAQAEDFASAGKGIAANTGTGKMIIDGTGKFTATGYRKMFGGATTENTLDSAVIRGLDASARASVVDGSNDDNYFYFTANEGDTKAVFAYPKTLTTKTPKFEMKTMSWGAFDGFTSSEVSVADMRGTNDDGTLNNPTTYTVWTLEASFDAAETPFRVCFK